MLAHYLFLNNMITQLISFAYSHVGEKYISIDSPFSKSP